MLYLGGRLLTIDSGLPLKSEKYLKKVLTNRLKSLIMIIETNEREEIKNDEQNFSI